MIPSCTLSPVPQSFALPYRVEKQDFFGKPAPGAEATGKYLQPLATLARTAQHLWMAAYGGRSCIVNSAVVEETLDDSTIWWLIFTRTAPSKENKVREWLRGRLPPGTLNADDLQPLTPWLQRRLGWGDARTTPEFLTLLRQEAQLPCLSFKDELVADRHRLAAEELRIREPQVPSAFSTNPVSRTCWGRLAYTCKQYGSDDMVGLLESTAATMAIPDQGLERNSAPLALGNGAATPQLPATVQSPEFIFMWSEVIRFLPRADYLRLKAACQLLRGGKPLQYDDDDDDDIDVDEDAPSKVCTVHVWGSEPFRVASAKPNYAETLRCIVRELGEDVTFARFLVKLIYSVNQCIIPCPLLDPKLLDQAKEIWAKHVGRKPVDALQAHDLDLVDAALGRPQVIRCRVCYKPCDYAKTRTHVSCSQHTFKCDPCNLKCDTSNRIMQIPKRSMVQPAEAEERYKMRKIASESLNLATTMWIRPKCQRCGSYARDHVCHVPERRPKTIKVAR